MLINTDRNITERDSKKGKTTRKGNSKKDTRYADPVPIKKVIINTLNNKINELNIYSNRKVSFRT